MNSADLVRELRSDLYAGRVPRQKRAADRIEAFEAWKAEAMDVLREIATAGRAIGSDDAVVRFYTETGYREINYGVFNAARRLVEKEDGRDE